MGPAGRDGGAAGRIPAGDRARTRPALPALRRARGIFRSWFRLAPECPTCGLALERGEREDHWFGAVAVNLVAAELLGIAAVVVWVAATWPDVPWTAVQYTGPAIMIALPLLFYPFSRALWLAWDLHFRPGASGDRRGLPAP